MRNFRTLHYTHHALRRMAEMGVTADEVEAVARAPQITYKSTPHQCWTLVGPRISIAVRDGIAPGSAFVVTVLWRNDEDWQADPRLPEGRHAPATEKEQP